MDRYQIHPNPPDNHQKTLYIEHPLLSVGVDAIFVCLDDFHKLSVTFSRIVLQVRENRRIFAPSNNNKEFNIIKIYN